jgi:hypothetical protein
METSAGIGQSSQRGIEFAFAITGEGARSPRRKHLLLLLFPLLSSELVPASPDFSNNIQTAIDTTNHKA